MIRFIRPWTQRLLRVCLPFTCWRCRTLTTEMGLCPPCWSTLHFIQNACDWCGHPLSYAQAPCPDRRCTFQNFFHQSVCMYNTTSRGLVMALKYHRTLGVGRFMAQYMAGVIRQNNIQGLLMPVPLHWTRLCLRRFNQSQWLVENISSLTQLPWSKELKRTQYTSSQGKDSRHQRWQKMHNVFSVTDIPKTQNIILIDDVYTTGATLHGCVQALRQCFSGKIYAVTFAKAPIPSVH